MSERPLLSIAIPTFNRATCLRNLLDSLCGQLSVADGLRIEVLVFDNFSEDDTPSVAQEFAKDRSYFRYVRNEQNIGADNNFVKAFSEGRGKYLWIVGDDELLFDGAIRWVLALCAREEFGCAYLYSVPDVLDRIPVYLRRPIPAAVDCRCYSRFAFAQAANYRLTFLSGSVINRDAVLKENPGIAADMAAFSGSNLVHLSWVFSAVLARPVSYLVTTPLFASTVANSGGYNPTRVFVVNLSWLFGHYFSRLNADAGRFIRWFTLIGWFPKVTFDWRFRGRYRVAGYVISREDFPRDMRSGIAWWVFDRCILRGPLPIAAIGTLVLKLASKFLQRLYISRGKRVDII